MTENKSEAHPISDEESYNTSPALAAWNKNSLEWRDVSNFVDYEAGFKDALVQHPSVEDKDAENYFNNHSRIFSGKNAGQYIDKKDFMTWCWAQKSIKEYEQNKSVEDKIQKAISWTGEKIIELTKEINKGWRGQDLDLLNMQKNAFEEMKSYLQQLEYQ